MLFIRASIPRVLITPLCALSFCFVAQQARAQILVQPDVSDSAANVQAWCDHHIPTPYRVHDRVVVHLMHNDEMTAYLRGDDGSGDRQTHQNDSPGDTDDIDGIFEDSPPRISLRLPDTGKPDMFTFAHEYGHYVWFHILAKSDRKRYETLYNHQRDAHRLVTEYAGTSLQEGFAEAFSFYIVEPAILNHRDPASSAFLIQFTQTHQSLTPS